ncbi:MAG: hypothetical protein DIZ80_09725 [endosymbiont of Galathealinum brachiosum]|uniref:FHA domain-containing protein n=1 Tax=endosymbiont of Galathealinum brachiosum TaxID=2200906 RepID=A0A370DDU5_9GAMM|nr:MAG: hypothetical protein DIZ80_09725 [endosymbiont of Galathealinum brachiosum]
MIKVSGSSMARIIQSENGQLTRQYFLKENHVSIGRSTTNLIQLDDTVISSNHAEIFIERDHHGNDIYFLMDLNSKNGSFINKDKVSCKQLKHKDRIRFGHQTFTFIDDKEYLKQNNNEKISQ